MPDVADLDISKNFLSPFGISPIYIKEKNNDFRKKTIISSPHKVELEISIQNSLNIANKRIYF